MNPEIIERDDVDPDDWITGTSYTECRVNIYRNPAIWAELQPLYEQIQAAEQTVVDLEAAATPPQQEQTDESSLAEADAPVAVPAGEESLGDVAVVESETLTAARAELDRLIAIAEDVYARYAADTEVWTLRALDEDEMRECIRDAGMEQPVEPKRVSRDASKPVRKKYYAQFDAYSRDMKAWAEAVNILCIQKACQGVVVAGAEKPAPSVESMRLLAKRPGGTMHIKRLSDALTSISAREVEIAAPKSLTASPAARRSS